MTRRNRDNEALADRIVDAALAQAGKIGWERVHLHELARELGVPLAEIRRHYRELDDVANAVLARAEIAMLAIAEEPEHAALPPPDRIYRAIDAWLKALAPHRKAVRAMLLYKLRPPHLHLAADLLIALSQSVQWLREAARLDATGRQKQLEETGLTLLFATTVASWLVDRSPDQRRTRERLRRRLMCCDRLLSACVRARKRDGSRTVNSGASVSPGSTQ